MEKEVVPDFYAVRGAVFLSIRLPGMDTILGPEMRSTGEMMDVGVSFGEAYYKARLGVDERLNPIGKISLIVRGGGKPLIVKTMQNLQTLGYGVCATRGTVEYLKERGIVVQTVNKVWEGHPHIVDAIENGEIALVVSTVSSSAQSISDSHSIHHTPLTQRVPQYTVIADGEAMSEGARSHDHLGVYSVQELHGQLKAWKQGVSGCLKDIVG